MPLNKSQTNTFKNPLSSVKVLHTSQTDTSCSMPINLRSGCTKCGERKSALRKLITSNEVLKAKLRVLASVEMKNRYLQKALSRKSKIEKTLHSKLLSAKKIMNKNNAMIKKLAQENLSLKQGSHHSEVRQLKRSLVALRYTYHKSKISYKMNEQK